MRMVLHLLLWRIFWHMFIIWTLQSIPLTTRLEHLSLLQLLLDVYKRQLQQCASILKNVDDIATISLTNRDVVRCKIVKDIVKAFEKEEAKAQEKTQKRAARRTSR